MMMLVIKQTDKPSRDFNENIRVSFYLFKFTSEDASYILWTDRITGGNSMDKEIVNITNQKGNLVVGSREIATNFEKQHKHVLEKINNITKDMTKNNSADFSVQYFIPDEYKDTSGKMNKEYLLTRDGFSLLVMGFTGSKALEWKIKYINAFNKMEKELKGKSVFKLPQTFSEALRQLADTVEENSKLKTENEALSSDILEWADENLINALVRKFGASIGNFGQAWTDFKKDALYKYSINLNSRITAYLNLTGKKTKPKTLSMLRGKEELTQGLKVAITLCKDNDIEISDILGTHMKEIERLNLE